MIATSTSLLAYLLQTNKIRALDHALAASLKRLRPDTSDAVCAVVAAVSYAHSLGHTALPLSQLEHLWQEKYISEPEYALPDAEYFQAALQQSSWLMAEDHAGILNLDHGVVSLRRYWQYEHDIAMVLIERLSRATLPMSDELEKYWQQLFADDLRNAQALAARRSYENPCLLLTGSPGTGKTTALGKILALLSFKTSDDMAAMPRIALAAPTGKAAMRISEALRHSVQSLQQQKLLSREQANALSLQATTLHRLLGYQMASVQFQHNQQHLLPIDILVLDEASMIDVPLFSKTLNALPPHARLIMVGDVAQLPSVELGQVLHDIHDAFSTRDRLKPYHVNLDYVYRQREALDISQAATFVREGKTQAFIEHCQQTQQLNSCIEWNPEEASFETVLVSQALHQFQAIQLANDLKTAFALSKKFRILCASRDDAFGMVAVNRLLSNRLNMGLSSAYFKGQCLMITANHPREQLYNGDLGLCWPDANGALRIWFEGAEALKSWHPQALPAHEDAFAITIHKAQGSEFDKILLVLPEAEHPVLTRELLYTGLTRARSQLYLWATRAALEAAINTPTQRWTQLASMLKSP
jgi:exodeoxyribonuclease V alpha subunit